MKLDRHRVYKRLETDEELRDRVSKRIGLPLRTLSGEALDDYAWTWYRLQRRIVEDTTER